MIGKIFAFLPDCELYHEKFALFLKMCAKHHLQHYVDSVKRDDVHFLKQFEVLPHCSYDIDFNVLEDVYDDAMVYIVCFNEDDEVKTWDAIHAFLKPFSCGEEGEYSIFNAYEWFKIPSVQMKELGESVGDYNPPTEYEFRKEPVEGKDIMVYEVVKPYTDRPYTVVIRNFSLYGHRRFFSSLFHANSWGVSGMDYGFLQQCWKHLEMEGEMDLEVLLKEHVEACQPRERYIPEPEPELYRADMKAVLELISDDVVCSKKKNRFEKMKYR